MGKQISLIIPKAHYPEPPHLFVGAVYIASYLKKKGFKVKIYDEQLGEVSKNLNDIKNNSFLIGFSLMTTQLKDAVKFSKLFKESNIPVVWGGIHPTMFPEQCLNESYVDYVVYDEGEETMSELAKHILDNKSLKIIKGLWYKQNDKFLKTEPRDYIDLNSVEPDWSFINFNNYEDKREINGKLLDVKLLHSGRGCPYSCSFCINTLLNKRKWRGLTSKNIYREFDRLNEIIKTDAIDFVDENFFLNKNRLNEFCDLYERGNYTFKWIANSRVNYLIPTHIDDILMARLKKCGCVELRMGIESGNQDVLDNLIKKGMSVKDVILVIKRLKKFGIKPVCSFMIGLPGETYTQQKDTLLLIKKILKINPDAHIIGPQLYRPYPGAEMYDLAKKKGFNEPLNNNSWIKFMNESGFVDVSKIPWIKNKVLLKNIYKIYTYSQIRPRGVAFIFGYFFKILFRLRIKLDFYKLGIDIILYEKIKSIYLKS